jgi:hypothetical protein
MIAIRAIVTSVHPRPCTPGGVGSSSSHRQRGGGASTGLPVLSRRIIAAMASLCAAGHRAAADPQLIHPYRNWLPGAARQTCRKQASALGPTGRDAQDGQSSALMR